MDTIVVLTLATLWSLHNSNNSLLWLYHQDMFFSTSGGGKTCRTGGHYPRNVKYQSCQLRYQTMSPLIATLSYTFYLSWRKTCWYGDHSYWNL